MEKLNPFSFVKDIEFTKKNLMESDYDAEKAYIPFVINKALSYHFDCVMFANEMNRRAHLPREMQYTYLLHTIRARRRGYNKWEKAEVQEDLDIIMRAYGYSRKIARTVLPLLTEHQLEILREKMNLGGVKKSK